MELEQIKELMAAMKRAGIKKASIKEKDGFEVHLERYGEMVMPAQGLPQPVFHPTHAPSFEPQKYQRFPIDPHRSPMTCEEGGETIAPKEKSRGTEDKFITSPMVGTFYSASSPEDPALVKLGDKIEENTVVCIIEAMKVMNEVKAGISGVVTEIYIENAHPVEFGTKLFKIS